MDTIFGGTDRALYTLGLMALGGGFAFAGGPLLRSVFAGVFVAHLLVGLYRAARLGRWWSLAHILGYYLFFALLFTKVFCLLRGADVGVAWNLALIGVAFANMALWVVAWVEGVKVDKGYPPNATLREYLSFRWLEHKKA